MSQIALDDLGDATKYSIPSPSRCCGDGVPRVPVEFSAILPYPFPFTHSCRSSCSPHECCMLGGVVGRDGVRKKQRVGLKTSPFYLEQKQRIENHQD